MTLREGIQAASLQPLDENSWVRFCEAYEPAGSCVIRGAFDTGGFAEMIDMMQRYQQHARDIMEHQPGHHDYQFMKDEVLRGRVNTQRFSRFGWNDEGYITRWAAGKLVSSGLQPLFERLLATDNLYLIEPTGRYKPATAPETGLPFHQDAVFLGDQFPVFVCWMPLVPCGESAPSIELIRLKLEQVLEQQSPESKYFRHLEISDSYVEQHYGQHKWAPVMQPSDMLLFTARTIHRTQPPKPGTQGVRASFDLRLVNGDMLAEQGVPERWKRMRYYSLRDQQIRDF